MSHFNVKPWLRQLLLSSLVLLVTALSPETTPARGQPIEKIERRLYVAVPGVRNYLEYGGHGVLVYDIDDGHKLLRRIPAVGLDAKGQPLNVKGICASVPLKRLFVSTTRTLTCFDLTTDKVLWEKPYD